MPQDEIRYCLFETALGPCGLAWSARGLTRLQLPEEDRAATGRRLAARCAAKPVAPGEPHPAATLAAVELLQRYFAGEAVDLTGIALDMTGIATFHRQIYAETRRLAWGRTASYGEIARRIGAEGAAQAVGQAMARNRMPIVIPCHRVLASGDRLGGFSAYGGVVTKQRLLELECVYPGTGTPLLPGLLD